MSDKTEEQASAQKASKRAATSKPQAEAETPSPKRLPDNGVARVRAADPRLRGYHVLGQEVTADGFEIDLGALQAYQRKDLAADRCVVVELLEE